MTASTLRDGREAATLTSVASNVGVQQLLAPAVGGS